MSVKRRFRIQSGNYGGELTIGEISKEFVDYFIGKDELIKRKNKLRQL